MFRLWGKLYKDNHLINDMVVERSNRIPTALQMDGAIEELVMAFDLQKPMWLMDNTKDFKQFKNTRFTQQHFIESIQFDYLEIELIEEDSPDK